MKFTAAVVLAAAAAGASAHKYDNATVVTEVVSVYTTFCPEATQITHGSKTYTVTEPTTLTITDCPCTVTRPVTSSSAAAPLATGSFTNSSVVAVTPTVRPSTVVGTGSGAVPTGPSTPVAVPTAGAGKAAVLSGAGLAGLVALAAFVL